MDPHHWQTVETIFNEALRLPLEERQAFLTSACAEDRELLTEVSSLLDQADENDNFLSAPMFELGAELLSRQSDSLIGTTLGSYMLVEMIGRGGMGEVYVARDDRLRRKVALKLLPQLTLQNRDGVRRFKHEARAASAISHPNVAHIYEIGEAEGRLFIAMEFVDGTTLRELIGQKGLAVGEGLEIATQVARAIAAAHAEGIVHRDIK